MVGRASALSPALSVWLDLCRILAALFVFVGHAVGLGVAPGNWSGQWHRSADDAVTAFFVISGIVIAHTSWRRRDEGLRAYAVARLSRVYSVAVPAVLFAYAVDLIGMRLDASHYVPQWQYPQPWLYIPLHWAFLGETWLGAFQPFTMAPYWSLAYEAWYYALFGCLFFLRGVLRWALAIVLLLAMGPRIWLLMPLWWLGVWLHARLQVWSVRPRLAWLMMAMLPLGYAALIMTGAQRELDVASKAMYAAMAPRLPFPFFSGSSVHVLSDLVMAVLFAVFVVGCAHSGWSFGPRTRAFIQRVAGFSFTFYLIHYTLLTLALALGWARLSELGFLGLLVGVLAVTWLHAQVGEQRRGVYARWIDRCLPGRRRRQAA